MSITKTKKTEEILQKNEKNQSEISNATNEYEKKRLDNIEKHQILLDESPDPIFSFTPEGRYIYVNRAFASGVGKSVEDIIDKFIWDVFSKEEAEHRFSALSSVFKTGEAKVIEVRVPRDDRDLFYITTITPIKNDNGEVIMCICSSKNITERKDAEDQIKTLLHEKEILLKEVHHRIKNNMNTISGLLFIQSRMQKNPEAALALQNAQSRVNSMGLLYDKLYQSSGYDRIHVKEYLSTLINEICNIFPNGQTIKVVTNINDFILDVKKLFPLGIIVNEIITNAMKYAYSNVTDGFIETSLSLEGDNAVLTISDNGPGLPEKSATNHATDSFGLQLVDSLTNQIGGNFRFEKDKGTKFILTFKI
ncbi:MAG TPA: histidine kinase dimerization/phosphoacceptor domain -containing protein [Candidatus Wallbacteria bacterium]|nr:histidine kinase dimerization/phosphoacceptor domain -containing protein [Candidatus Wallbacteria bacterium]